MGIGTEGPLKYTFRDTRPGRDDLDSERWNKELKKQTVKVVAAFYWENRLLLPGEMVEVPVLDAEDLVRRGKARKA